MDASTLDPEQPFHRGQATSGLCRRQPDILSLMIEVS